jgi:uncharacterized protein YcfL
VGIFIRKGDIMKKILIVIMLFILCGCASPFSQNYYDQTRGLDLTKVPFVVIPTEEPKLFRGSNPQKDMQSMLENGYQIIGYSSFNAGNVDINGALRQAKQAHASIVLLYSQYTDTASGSLPLMFPKTQTTTSSMYGSAYGSGGYASYSGTGYTTTYGTQTIYFPYSVRRYDYLATYWIKLKPPVLGAHTQNLTTELRQAIQSNKGVVVHAVIKGSPAFYADILKGDILKKIADIEIYDVKTLQQALIQHQGQRVSIKILRNGKEIQKQVKLRQKSY